MILTANNSTSRLDGLDFARFIAFAGMVIVNFRIVVSFDTPTDNSVLGYLISLLEGRAAATFVVLAGIGLGLAGLKGELNHTILLTLKRAAFLLVLGLLNMRIFDADILHYYAFYFLIGSLMLPFRVRSLLLAIMLLVALSVLLILALDYDEGWVWSDYRYTDFWTPEGFIRNLFFNGWHPIVPWAAYLLFGIVLSRCHLATLRTQRWLVGCGLLAIASAELVSSVLKPYLATIDPQLIDLATTSAIPPMPLYMLAGIGTASTVIGLCLILSKRWACGALLALLVPAGRQSLTLYIAHIVIGMGTLEALGMLGNQSLAISLTVALLFCALAVLYAKLWSCYFRRGPIETLMRKLVG